MSTSDSELAGRSESRGGRSGSVVGRLWEWHWGGAALRQARDAGRDFPPAITGSARQCRLAIELADYARRPIEPFRNGYGYGHACELYRQAMYWALALQRQTLARDSAELESNSAAPMTASVGELLAGLEEAGWLGAGYEAPPQALVPCRSPVQFATLSDAEARAGALHLHRLSTVLLEHTDAPFAARRLWRRRLVRVAGTVSAIAFLVLGVVFAVDRYRLSHDLAAGKPWRASSGGSLGCRSPERSCPGSPDFFFHTRNQAEPWFEIDFGEETSFSSLYIKNRADCCTARAIPLIVEVWDGQGYRQVARRNDKFETWRPTFDTVRATKVRLRVARWSYLHLQDVRVLP